MRLSLAATACCLLGCWVATALAAPGQTFPYKAYVIADDVYVRSGPGDNYYPTEKLKTGDPVEVYRHDPGGWLAIRPLSGSFSWVSGRYLELGRKNLATVSEEHVAARVGSRFSDIRDVIQVRLHRGELVEVLDAKREGPDAARRRRLVQDCPAGGRVPLDFRPVRRRRLPLQRSAEDPRRRPGRLDRRHPGPAAPFETAVNRIELDLSTVVVEEPAVWQFDELRGAERGVVEPGRDRGPTAAGPGCCWARSPASRT